ncbi:hypothetical protein DENSPDRAFT_874728 [Dentipellis sp. KUC8613]|nr:hypothetical protein DENSPDRAFT_874728 [Dentipellis sp. KUC8613]
MDDLARAKEIVITLQQNKVVSFYDFVLNLSDEVDLVWRSRWNTVKILYLLNRYFAFVNIVIGVYQEVGYHMSSSRCHSLYTATAWVIAYGIGISEMVLIFRTWALWGKHNRLACTIVILFVVCWVVLSIYVEEFTRSLVFVQINTISPGLRGCFIVKASKVLCVCWSIALAYETLIVGLTLIKAFQNFRHSTSLLLLTIYRDGVLSYISLLVSSIANVLVIRLAPPGYMNLLFGIQHALHIVLTSRLILNIRRNAPATTMATSDMQLEQTQASSDLTAVSQS